MQLLSPPLLQLPLLRLRLLLSGMMIHIKLQVKVSVCCDVSCVCWGCVLSKLANQYSMLLPLLMLLDVLLHLLSPPLLLLLLLLVSASHFGHGPPRQQAGQSNVRHRRRHAHRPQVVQQAGRRDFGPTVIDRMSQGIVNKTEFMKDKAHNGWERLRRATK